MNKKTFFGILLIALFFVSFQEINAQKYEYRIVTSIESVVPMGLGRSRIISNQEDKDYKTYTSSRTEEKTLDVSPALQPLKLTIAGTRTPPCVGNDLYRRNKPEQA